MEREMEEVFDMKVQEKLQKLKDIEADVSSVDQCNRIAGNFLMVEHHTKIKTYENFLAQ